MSAKPKKQKPEEMFKRLMAVAEILTQSAQDDHTEN